MKSDNLTVLEAANYLRLAKATLDKLRVTGGGPAYVQVIPHGKIIYRRCDLVDWLADRTIRSSSSGHTPKKVT